MTEPKISNPNVQGEAEEGVSSGEFFGCFTKYLPVGRWVL